MPLFKDRISSEACPAKTAESVGYVATFAVLGWLLLSYYPAIDNPEQSYQSAANSNASSVNTPAQDPVAVNQPSSPADVIAFSEILTATSDATTGLVQTDPEIGANQLRATLPAWQPDIAALRQYTNQAQHREFSALDWAVTENAEDQKISGYSEALTLTLPLIEPDYFLGNLDRPNGANSGDLTSKNSDQGQSIRAITVTGTETARLSNRPDNIQRPQIPRPYRAQDIQRSFVLPPRIQALKP